MREASAWSAKQASIEQWTQDPCDAHAALGEPRTESYVTSLLAARNAYAPWLAEVLDYSTARGLSVLDVGCGQGVDLVRFATAGAQVTGNDLTPRHVDLARGNLAAAGCEGQVVLGDAEALPFADRSFDRVISNGVLHHTPDIATALREIWRVLVPGGEARMVVYNRASAHYWLQQVLCHGILRGGLAAERSMAGVLRRGVERSSGEPRPLVRVYTRRRVRRLMTQAGFSAVTTGVRHFHARDTFLTAPLEHRSTRLRDPSFLDRLGRIAGWYVVGAGARDSGPDAAAG